MTLHYPPDLTAEQVSGEVEPTAAKWLCISGPLGGLALCAAAALEMIRNECTFWWNQEALSDTAEGLAGHIVSGWMNSDLVNDLAGIRSQAS